MPHRRRSPVSSPPAPSPPHVASTTSALDRPPSPQLVAAEQELVRSKDAAKAQQTRLDELHRAVAAQVAEDDQAGISADLKGELLLDALQVRPPPNTTRKSVAKHTRMRISKHGGRYQTAARCFARMATNQL